MSKKKVTESQTVKLFSDESREGVQVVDIDKNDKDGTWLSITHCGDGFFLSLENWNKMVAMVEKAKARIDGKKA